MISERCLVQRRIGRRNQLSADPITAVRTLWRSAREVRRHCEAHPEQAPLVRSPSCSASSTPMESVSSSGVHATDLNTPGRKLEVQFLSHMAPRTPPGLSLIHI